MKKIFIFLALGLSLYAYNATKVAHELNYLNSFDKGVALAQKEHKMVMLVIVRDHCPWCKKLESETLTNKSVKNATSKFVKVIIDINQKMPKSFKSPIVPIVSFVDAKTKEATWEAYGYRRVKDFLKDIKNAQDDEL
ncbi:MAG: thioredoxin family protein [Sulfurospirillaceae bacterium]|nr:thioredoxin family protein [Sulfurospirillaceae bacterium]